jgi:cytochrome c551/c552
MKKIIFTSVVFAMMLSAQSAQEIIDANGCSACHAVASKKLAPAFAGIGRRNKMQNGSNAKDIIIKSIKNGSSGKYPMFADSKMPPYPKLSTQELSTLADYILAQSSKAKGHGGKCHGKGMGQGGKMGHGMGRGGM